NGHLYHRPHRPRSPTVFAIAGKTPRTTTRTVCVARTVCARPRTTDTALQRPPSKAAIARKPIAMLLPRTVRTMKCSLLLNQLSPHGSRVSERRQAMSECTPVAEALAAECEAQGITSAEVFRQRYGITQAEVTMKAALMLLRTPPW